MKKAMLYLVFFICCFLHGYSQKKTVDWECILLKNSEINNLLILSDCYGYVRYFYPNPNTQDFDWQTFLMYSIQKMDGVSNDKELKDVLFKLFKPLCPQIFFSTDTIDTAERLPFPCYVMEHKAIGLLAEMAYGKTYSPIVQVAEGMAYNNAYCFRLKENLYINFPIAVSALHARTEDFNQLLKKVNEIDKGGIGLMTALLNKKKAAASNLPFKQLSYRIADVMIRHNIVRHFYPYFEEDGLNESWDAAFAESLTRIAQVDNLSDYYLEISRMMAYVKDSHLHIWNTFHAGAVATYAPFYYPDVSVALVNDTCLLLAAGKKYAGQTTRGDILSHINGKPARELVNQKLAYSSWSTRNAGLHDLAVLGGLFESAVKDSVIQATFIKKDKRQYDLALQTKLFDAPFNSKHSFVQSLGNGLIYINLCSDSCTYKNFEKYIPLLQSSKGIVFDVRGRPQYDVLPIISHFITETIELGNLLQPIIRFPNQVNVEYKTVEKWRIAPAVSPQNDEISKKYEYKKPQPLYIEKSLVFLTNEKTISFGETFMEMMKHYKTGTIVGTPTAGCNGDVTRISMPCATFFMTYNKFLNRDGSQHHGIGVLPDVYCEMRISDIQQNMDTQLEKAKEILN